MAKRSRRPDPAAPNPMHPSAGLLAMLASAVVHAEEFLSAHGDPADKTAFVDTVRNPEVRDWLAAMTKLGMAPVKRNYG